MCIGPDDGCHEVPDPIAPIDMMFVSLDPTRRPISFPFITINGPLFIFIPLVSMPGICPIGLAEGLAEGMGIFISIFWGDAPGDALGIGMFISILGCGEACGFGDAVGICIPGMFICVGGDDDGEGLA